MCPCTATQRCVDAHGLRDAYQQARDMAVRLEVSATYTTHLRLANLLGPTETASPTWTCAEACAPTAPCRAPRNADQSVR
jgi:hypothetical protein